MENSEKMVYFDKYCPICKHEKTNESKDPCNECLSNPVNKNTHEPVMWKEK